MAMAAAVPMATVTTLAHRLPMLFEAMAGSTSWSNPEFQRMASEKVHAAGQTVSAINNALAAGQQAMADYALAQASANVALMTRPPVAPDQILAFSQASAERLAALAEALSEIGSRTATTGLRPAHRKVTANARRLAAQKAMRPK